MILQRYKGEIKSPDLNEIKPVFKAEDIRKFQQIIKQVRIEDQLVRYIAQVVHESRNHAKLYLGASPRASLAILKASKALAAIRGRDFVVPDDIQYIAPHVMNHRIILSPEAEMEGLNPQEVIKEIMHSVEVPR